MKTIVITSIIVSILSIGIVLFYIYKKKQASIRNQNLMMLVGNIRERNFDGFGDFDYKKFTDQQIIAMFHLVNIATDADVILLNNYVLSSGNISADDIVKFNNLKAKLIF